MFTGHSQSGLVSAAIAAFLEQILQVQAFAANLNTSTPDTDFGPSTLSTPSTTQILWFCGLAMSLSSALLAMLLQSWIRRYMAMTQPRQRPHSRALIQASVRHKGSLDSLQLILDGLHLLLDIAILTFLAGLIDLLSQTSLDFGVSLAVSLISPLIF